jgi:hypothetical protein
VGIDYLRNALLTGVLEPDVAMAHAHEQMRRAMRGHDWETAMAWGEFKLELARETEKVWPGAVTYPLLLKLHPGREPLVPEVMQLGRELLAERRAESVLGVNVAVDRGHAGSRPDDDEGRGGREYRRGR